MSAARKHALQIKSEITRKGVSVIVKIFRFKPVEIYFHASLNNC